MEVEMSTFTGDFLGFTLGGVHSSSLNIVRTSSGDRYNNNLIPEFQDVTFQVPGGDGTYYQDTFFNRRTFQIDFAYDSLTEENMRQLAQILSFKGVKPLIFDEAPHKKYMVKCSSAPNLKYICFFENGTKIYKGEGNITFVAYYPFALSTTDYVYTTNNSVTINNIGDLEADCYVYYNISTTAQDITLTNSSISSILVLTGVQRANASDPNTQIMINMKTHLIEGLNSSNVKTGTLYNKNITSGDFFKLQVGNNVLTSSPNYQKITCNFLYY